MITEYAYAKINLSLDIIGRRSNGYHDVKMVMQTISLRDELVFEKTDEGISLETDSEVLNSESASGSDNLVIKAARLLYERYPIPAGVSIKLKKNIPLAAGMAGGSADAAATLRGINRLYKLGLSCDKLCKIGVEIGADVPFCVTGGTMLCEGIGEIMTPVMNNCQCLYVICKPNVNVSTKAAYEMIDTHSNLSHPDVAGLVSGLEEGNLTKVAGLSANIFEKYTKEQYPEIAEIEDIMINNGALCSVMSGSGPTVFGIFSDGFDVSKVIDILKADGSRFVCTARPCR